VAEQRRVALIFAVDEYDHPDLQRLSAPVADANALAETLGRLELGGFAVDVCHNPTSAVTAERLEDFLIERGPGDLALLHFSGHRLKDESGVPDRHIPAGPRRHAAFERAAVAAIQEQHDAPGAAPAHQQVDQCGADAPATHVGYLADENQGDLVGPALLAPMCSDPARG